MLFSHLKKNWEPPELVPVACSHRYFFVVGWHGPPAVPLGWGQAGGRRVGVPLPGLCRGDPLQRSTNSASHHSATSSSSSSLVTPSLNSGLVSIEIQFLQQWSNRVILPLYLYLYLISGDVLEQTGVGSHTRCWCCWCRWCSKVPVNLRHVCGGKRFMARLLAADGIALLQLFTHRGLFLLIAAFFFHLFFVAFIGLYGPR